MSTDRSFLGRGVAFPMKIDGAGGLALSAYEENIEECIRIILGTAPGERVYRPEFGCRIHDLLFAPNNDNTCNLAAFYVKEALLKWEPRIRGIEVEARVDSLEESTLRVEISYSVRATNSHYNMVYPFYLRREDDL